MLLSSRRHITTTTTKGTATTKLHMTNRARETKASTSTESDITLESNTAAPKPKEKSNDESSHSPKVDQRLQEIRKKDRRGDKLSRECMYSTIS